MDEIFKDVVGYEGLYEVSNLGNVIRINYRNTGKRKLIKPHKNKNGYVQIHLWKNEKRQMFYVHRLVAEAFILNPENKPFIDHINTIRDDNMVENLKWCTRLENNNNPLTKEKVLSHLQNENHPMLGKHHTEGTKKNMSISQSGEKNHMYGKIGEKHHNSKPILQYSKDGTFIREWASMADVQRELGISEGDISNVCARKPNHKTAGGYVWKYLHKN